MVKIFEIDKKSVREVMHTMVAYSQVKILWSNNLYMIYIWKLLFHNMLKNHGINNLYCDDVDMICECVNSAVAKYYPDFMKTVKYISYTPKIGSAMGISINSLVNLLYIYRFAYSVTNVCLTDDADLELYDFCDKNRIRNWHVVSVDIIKCFEDFSEMEIKEELCEIKDIYLNTKYGYDGEIKEDVKMVADATKLNAEVMVDFTKMYAESGIELVKEISTNIGEAVTDVTKNVSERIKKFWNGY